ncbi:MAG: glycosyltransferase, partial [Myxococcaceae bacterium]
AVIVPSQHAARLVLRELGLIGLRHYVVHPTLPPQRRSWAAPAPLFHAELGTAPFHNRTVIMTAQALAGCKVGPNDPRTAPVAFIDLSSGELQGAQILQALVDGTPVIALREGSASEWLGDAALYVERGSPEELAALMSRLLTDNGLRQTLVRRSAERVEHWPKRDALERIYREVLARSDPASRARRRWLRVLCQPLGAR